MASTIQKRSTKPWSYIAGEKGRNRVRVFTHPVTGRLFLEFRDEGGRKRRVALGHRDEEQAKAKAETVAVALRAPEKLAAVPLTLGALFDNYLRERTPSKSLDKQRHDRAASRRILDVLGQGRRVGELTHRDGHRFAADRFRLGDLRRKQTVGRPLGVRQVQYDLGFLQATLNWALGAGLLDRNPMRGFRVAAKPETPRRPQLTSAHYQALLKVANQVAPDLRLALVLAHETGHRIGAIRCLRWSEIDLKAKVIRWRRENDKIGYEHDSPISVTACRALRQARRNRPRIGDGWVFPSPADPGRPVSRHLIRDWWEKGEQRARIRHDRGKGWHSLRRKFATDLKHVPIRDLCALGGWKDPQTVLKCYQQPDEATMRQALEQRRQVI